VSEEQVSEKILTIPNVISFIRLLAIPFFWWLVLGAEDIAVATILFAVIATTDWVDGYLARRLGQVSRLGKNLDPIADRLMIASGVVAGLIAGIVPPVIGWVLIVREIYMALVTLRLVSAGGGVLKVRWLGKVATFAVYSSVGAFYIAEVPFIEVFFRPFAWVTGVGGLVLYWYTAILYTGDARNALSELESTANPEES
jgi:cardiolipin synthase